jgi:RNA polymerase sigma factor (sigma-70 family)
MPVLAAGGLNRLGTFTEKTTGVRRETVPSESAFREFFLKNYDRVVNVLCRFVGDFSQAEELANDVFWRFYQRRISVSGDSHAGGWLYRTATRVGIDALRAAARRRRYESAAAQSETFESANPLEEVLRAERCAGVRSALASLRPAQAQLLILRASGFSYKELAEILNAKSGSIGVMLIRAEAAFRKRYKEDL